MWYYIKHNRTIGPVADSAILGMFKSGEIDQNTLVRSGSGRSWKSFKMTRFYSRMSRKRSLHLESLSIRTKVVRAFLTAFMILVALTFVLNLDRFEHFNRILGGTELSAVFLGIIKADYENYMKTSNAIQVVVFLMVLYALMRWLNNITFNARMLDKQFSFSPLFAAWSLLIPLVNFIHPFVVISTVYKSAKGVAGGRYTIYDAAFILIWWFFSMFSVLLFAMDKWMLKFSITLDKAKAVLVFNMYAIGVYVFTIFLWIVLVSVVYRLQKAAFSTDI